MNRRLGQSRIELPPVILGAWGIGGWFWGGPDDAGAVDAIAASVDAGIDAVDTAPVYGMGHSERVVGRAVAALGRRVQVFTKVGLRWDDARGERFFQTRDNEGQPVDVHRNLRPDSIRFEVQQSLDRMGLSCLDLVQCHWPDPTTPVEESMDALVDLVNEGLVAAIGVSNFGVELLDRCRKALVARGHVLVSTQPRYSLLDRRVEEGVLPWCRLHNVGVLAYSPIERGLLAGAIPENRVFPPSDGRARDPLFSVDNRRAVAAALNRASEMASAHGCTLAQLAAAWCFHRPGVTAAIVGARNRAQARENAGAMAVRLSEEECRALGLLFEGVVNRSAAGGGGG